MISNLSFISCLPAVILLDKNPFSNLTDLRLDIIYGFMPETIMIIAILILCCLAFLIKPSYRKTSVVFTSYLGTILALITSFYYLISQPNNFIIFSGMFNSNVISLVFRLIILAGTVMVIALSINYLEKEDQFEPEFFILLLTAVLGAMLMTGANDLIMVFVATETLGISSYMLTGYIRSDKLSNEASLKYLIIGSAATAIFLFGMSYLYGLTGATTFNEISYRLTTMGSSPTLIVIIMMIIFGVGYKMAVAPFHMAAPDVYQGAPTPISAFLSVISKSAGFILMIRFIILIFPQMLFWEIIFAILAILSMFIGNLTALVQSDIKRLLAYSSIAHAGYIVIGFVINSTSSFSSMIYYLIIYMFMQLGAWCCVILFYDMTKTNKIEDYSGLVYKRPLLTASFTICLLSLAGIPITAGFFAKFYIFQSAILGGSEYLWLIIIALINSAISLYYYLYVIKVMILNKPSNIVDQIDNESNNLDPQNKTLTFLLGFSVSAVIFMGILASPLIDISRYSVEQLINCKINVLNINS